MFGHSIGVMHVASNIYNSLVHRREILGDMELHQNIRLAALLHDIGHPPFSHVSENVLKFFRPPLGERDKEETLHEEISQRIITENKDIVRILTSPRAERIAELLRTDNVAADYCHDIISGSLDGDKMDYLLRDSYYTGVKYGVFDIDRLINVLTLIDEGAKRRLAIKQEGICAVEQYVLAKYFIAQQVYFHKIRRITDIMIIEGLKRAIEEGNTKLKQLYTYRDDPSYPDEYITFDDHTVMDEILTNSASTSMAFKYFDGFRRRVLPKELFYSELSELTDEKTREAMGKRSSIAGDTDLRDRISDSLSLNPDFTFVRAYSLKDPLVRGLSEIDEEGIVILLQSGRSKTLYDGSPLFKVVADNSGKHFISVYGLPLEIDKYERDKGRLKLESILKEYFGGKP